MFFSFFEQDFLLIFFQVIIFYSLQDSIIMLMSSKNEMKTSHTVFLTRKQNFYSLMIELQYERIFDFFNDGYFSHD